VTESFRSLLRSLPDFPASLPPFDAKVAESDPALLFQGWLAAALAAGVPQPHAFSLATATADGQPSSRMLILKNIDEAGWHFASSAKSRKGLELSENPRAAMNFYWPKQGRQVRVVGSVIELSAEASAQDWDERPGADGRPNPSWRLYALRPSEIEFWQASADRNHVRYRIEVSK
jgi:pyridoxamine 5'-phosphate oxidase